MGKGSLLLCAGCVCLDVISVVEGSGAGGVLNLEGKRVINPELFEVFVKEIFEALYENCDP